MIGLQDSPVSLHLVVCGSFRIRRQGYRGIGTASCPTGPSHSLQYSKKNPKILLVEACSAVGSNFLSLTYQRIYPAPRLMVPLLRSILVSNPAMRKARQAKEMEDAIVCILAVQANKVLVGGHLHPD